MTTTEWPEARRVCCANYITGFSRLEGWVGSCPEWECAIPISTPLSPGLIGPASIQRMSVHRALPQGDDFGLELLDAGVRCGHSASIYNDALERYKKFGHPNFYLDIPPMRRAILHTLNPVHHTEERTKAIASLLRLAIRRAGLTQDQAMVALGIKHKSQFSEMLDGKQKLWVHQLLRPEARAIWKELLVIVAQQAGECDVERVIRLKDAR